VNDQRTGPINPASTAQYKDALPDSVDVVVIGGGVLGVTSALFLNRAGLKTVLCEKGVIAGEQSSRNWGWIRQLGRDPAELPLVTEASQIWQDLDGTTGGRTGYRREGIIFLASNRQTLDERSAWLPVAEKHGLDVRVLDGAGIAKMIDTGEGGKRWAGGIWCPSDARAEPWRAVPAVAALAREEGVLIREGCAARALEIASGRVTGVHTEDGFVACAQLVVAGGAWTSLLLRRHGISIPQLAVRSSVARTAPLPQFFAGAAMDEHLAFRRREDGGFTLASLDRHDLLVGPDAFRHLAHWLPVAKQTLGHMRFRPWGPKHYPDAWGTARYWAEDEETPFERCRVLHPDPDPQYADVMRRRFAERFPSIGAPPILNTWAGMIDAMPDIVPVVDHVPGIEGLIVGCGLSGHGFGIGPAFGKAIAAMATGRETGHDMHRFRFSRFTDGSRLEPGPGI
jgi:glycine/D-amino acid oxidase-like deaminating enzyme